MAPRRVTGSEFAKALRAIADWYDEHPDIPTPAGQILSVYDFSETAEEAARIARALGRSDRVESDTLFSLRRDFGGVTLSFVFYLDGDSPPRSAAEGQP